MAVNNTPDSHAEFSVLEKVLDTFFSIDKKIHDLHRCSSDDFLSLNKTLKQNHQKANYIIDSVFEAFQKIGSEGNLKNIEMLKLSMNGFREEMLVFEKEINNYLDILEKVQSNFSLMFVPINNFRQNLASLKLLLSNIKLTNSLYDKSLKGFSREESYRIESVLNKVKESCPVFEENIYVIQKHLKTLYSNLVSLKDMVSNDVLQKLEVLQTDLDIIEKHNRKAIEDNPVIEKIAKNCNNSVGSIITNLQYHDIIRQKMEHIQQTHKLIIKEINDNNDDNNGTGSSETSNPFYLQIPQIVDIQTAQLLHTNKEYQNAIEHISKKMLEIGKDMAAIARIYKSLSVFEYKGRSVSRERLTEVFEELLQDKKQCLGKFNTQIEDVHLIHRIVKNLFDKFKDIEMIENSIEQNIIDKISFGNLLVSEETETASQAQQILKLYADNHFEKSKIRSLFENTNGLLKELIRDNAVYAYEGKGIEKINKNIESVEANFASINTNLLFLESNQPGIVHKSTEVDNSSNEVINNVKYYDFFEKTIDVLVKKFESIRSVLDNHSSKYFDTVDQKKGLDQIEKYYTMKSERLIHNNHLLNKINDSELQDILEGVDSNSTDNANEGNDVEFF